MDEATKAELETQLVEKEQQLALLTSIDGVLDTINKLSVEDKKLLAAQARTTDIGIKAYKAINYGA